MPTEPLRFYDITTKRTSRTVCTIEVQKHEGSYRVHRVDVISTNIQNHGLITGEKGEKTAESRIEEKTLGVYKTLEEANEKATAIHHKSMGWTLGG